MAAPTPVRLPAARAEAPTKATRGGPRGKGTGVMVGREYRNKDKADMDKLLDYVDTTTKSRLLQVRTTEH